MPDRKPMREFRTKVVGVTYTNPDGESRQRIIKKCTVGEDILLERQPNNPHDENAIAVRRRNTGDQIGYLSREVAQTLVRQADAGKEFSAEVAEIIGGGGWLSDKNLGVILTIGLDDPEAEDS